jgi:DNA-binding IclR family transcriptional regulator
MQNSYFQNVITKLTHEDINLLTILREHEATSIFKAVRNQKVFEQSNLTEAQYRRVFNRLVALDFIHVTPSSREYLLYLTPYGEAAHEEFFILMNPVESEVV